MGKVGDIQKLAKDIDERVHQILQSAPETSDHELMARMVGFMPALQQIYAEASDEVLMALVERLPGFYKYAQLMEDASQTLQHNPAAANLPPGLKPLPDSVKPVAAQMLGDAATLEREMQALVTNLRGLVTAGKHANGNAFSAEKARAQAIAELHNQWVVGLNRLADAMQKAGVAPVTAQWLAKTLDDMNERIHTLNKQFFSLVLAGQAAANNDPQDTMQ